jgi:hypothetical protein
MPKIAALLHATVVGLDPAAFEVVVLRSLIWVHGGPAHDNCAATAVETAATGGEDVMVAGGGVAVMGNPR